jgi:hypothetical protein
MNAVASEELLTARASRNILASLRPKKYQTVSIPNMHPKRTIKTVRRIIFRDSTAEIDLVKSKSSLSMLAAVPE